MGPATLTAVEELCAEAQARGLRVGLELEGVGSRTRLTRVSVRKPTRPRQEVAAVRIVDERIDLEKAARACLTFLLRAKARR